VLSQPAVLNGPKILILPIPIEYDVMSPVRLKASTLDPKVIVWQGEEIGDSLRRARELTSSNAVWIQHDSDDAGSYDDLLDKARTEPVSADVDPHDALLVIYTAAHSGRPAGSMLSHRNLITMALQTGRVTDAHEDCIFVNSGPLFHIGNFQFDSLPVFVMGGTNIYIRRIEEDELLKLIATEKVTSGFLMPPTILRLKELNATAGLDISSLRAGAFAPPWGDALPPDDTRWGHASGGFGQTEVTGLSVLNGYGGRGIGNSGRPTPLCQVRILDPDLVTKVHARQADRVERVYRQPFISALVGEFERLARRLDRTRLISLDDLELARSARERPGRRSRKRLLPGQLGCTYPSGSRLCQVAQVEERASQHRRSLGRQSRLTVGDESLGRLLEQRNGVDLDQVSTRIAGKELQRRPVRVAGLRERERLDRELVCRGDRVEREGATSALRQRLPRRLTKGGSVEPGRLAEGQRLAVVMGEHLGVVLGTVPGE